MLLWLTMSRKLIFTALCCIIGLLASCGVGPGQISVLSNQYGVVLLNDGSDNASRWQHLQAAVPSGAALYFPKGNYHNSSAFGWVLNKSLKIVGESSGSYDGTSVTGAALFLDPITLNDNFGSSVAHVAIDVRSSAFSDGVSSGSAITTSGGMQVDDILYIGTGLVNPGHAVLMQSGPINTVTNVRAYDAFHVVAVRSSTTTVSKVYALDSYDVIVKSASSSGSVQGVSLTNVTCAGDGDHNGCQIRVESDDPNVMTSGVMLNGMTCNDVSWCLVFHTENGGVVNGVSATSVSGSRVGTGIYAYVLNGGGSMSNITVSGPCFSDVQEMILNSAKAGLQLSPSTCP